jgi:hypothetical protein
VVPADPSLTMIGTPSFLLRRSTTNRSPGATNEMTRPGAPMRPVRPALWA